MRTPLNLNRYNQQGFILIELAIIMIVIGVLIAAAIPFYNAYIQREAPLNTQKRMLVIENALSNFIQTRFRLPCPADPIPASTPAGTNFGLERPSLGAGLSGCESNDTTLSHGIIPYRTLGLPEQYAKDGWGNYFTYVVSPDFTGINNFNTTATDTVHRRLIHHFADAVAADDLIDVNHGLYPRALFCAPRRPINGVAESRDITIIQDGVAIDIVPDHLEAAPFNLPAHRQVLGGDIVPVGDAIVDANLNRDAFVSAIAVAVISHGENGLGAYQGDGSQKPFPGGIPATAAERVTVSNADRTISSNSLNDSVGTDEYDDIVNFYTQEEIYAIAGGGSCEHL